MKKINNKFLKIFLLILGFTILCSVKTSNNLNEVHAAGTVNVPVQNNSEKLYHSNIPSVWYDTNYNCGAYSKHITSSGPEHYNIFYDLISTDGLENYAGKEYFRIKPGEQIEFYLEVGFTNWGNGVPDLSFMMPTDLVSTTFILSQEYDNVKKTLYNSYEAYTQQSYSNYYNELARDAFDDSNANKYVIYNENDQSLAAINDKYRLPKFTITGNNKGYDVYNFVITGSGDSYNSVEVSFVVIVCDDNDPIIDNYRFSINAFNGITYYNNQYAFNEINILLPYAEKCNYQLVEEYGQFEQGVQGSIYNMATYKCRILNEQGRVVNINYDFNTPNLYKCKLQFYLSIASPNFGVIKEVVLYEIDVFIISYLDTYDFKLLKDYERYEVKENQIDLFTTDSIQDFIIYDGDSEFEDYKYYLDGEEITSDTILTAGIHNFVVEANNKFLKQSLSNLNPNTSFNYDLSISKTKHLFKLNVRDVSDLTPVPVISLNENEVIKLDEINKLNNIKIINTDYLKQCNAKISYCLNNYPEYEVSLDYPDLYLAEGCKLGVNTLYIYVVNLKGDIETYVYSFTVDKVDLDYGISKTDIKIKTGEDGEVKFGLRNIQNQLLEIPGFGYYDSKEGGMQAYRFAFFPAETNVVSLEHYDGDSQTLTFKGIGDGKTTALLALCFGDQTLQMYNLTFEVKNDYEGDEPINVNSNFNEGDTIRIVLNSSINTTLNIPSEYNTYTYTWFSTNPSSVMVSGQGATANLYFGNEGEAEVFAIYQDSDINLVFKTKVMVIDEIPTIAISIDKTQDNDNSSYSIYDILEVKINTNGFIFSPNTTYKWYLDNEELLTVYDINGERVGLSSSSSKFNYKFTEGTHSLKVVANDLSYGFNVDAIKDINITKLVNQERFLSFEIEKLYLIDTGSSYDLSCLMDGVLNDDFKYTWIVDDSTILKLYSNETSKATILPVKSGTTNITVFCNVGKYEDKIIRTQIEVQIDEFENINFTFGSEYPKPNENLVVNVLINNRNDYKNVNLDFNILINDNPVEFDYDAKTNQINLTNIPSGELSVSADFQGQNYKSMIKITNFNIKEFLSKIMPYVLLVLVLFIGIYYLYKVSNNPIKNVTRTANNLDKKLSKFVANTNNGLFNNKLKYIISLSVLKYRSRRLLNTLTYYYDEGIDEFKHSINKIKLLDEGINYIKNNRKNLTEDTFKEYVNGMYKNIFKTAKIMIDTEVASRLKFEDQFKESNIKDAKEYRDSIALKKEQKKLKKQKDSDKNSKDEMNEFFIKNSIVNNNYKDNTIEETTLTASAVDEVIEDNNRDINNVDRTELSDDGVDEINSDN